MDRSDADQQNPLMSQVPEDNSRDNRPFPLPACVSSGLAAVISVFCIGLVSGAAGGLLLGGTAVVTLQSLELLADNRLLMNQLETYLQTHETENNIRISMLTEIFVFISSTLSLAAGIYIGLSTYSLVIKKKGQAAMGKALAKAGLVCVTGVTATGYIVGFTLEMFLSISLHVDIDLWLLISVVFLYFFIITCALLACISAISVVASCVFLMAVFVPIRFHLAAVLIPITLIVIAFGKSHSLKLTTVPVRWMLIISDVYYIAGQQIVSLQSQTSTNISNAVVEAIFVGVLVPLLWTVTVGMSLFVSWEKGGSFKICATAATYGTAVLGAIKMTVPVLGPGPTIGALIGVAGAVGVSLSAAVALTDQYGQALNRFGIVGRLGLTVGAAVGAFLFSCAHSGLSGMFMALCATTIPAGAFTILFLHQTHGECEKRKCINLISIGLISSTYAGLIYVIYTKLISGMICFLSTCVLILLMEVFTECCQ